MTYKLYLNETVKKKKTAKRKGWWGYIAEQSNDICLLCRITGLFDLVFSYSFC